MQKSAHSDAKRRFLLIFAAKSPKYARMSRWGIIGVAVFLLSFGQIVSATPATVVDGATTTTLSASLRPVARNYTPLPEMRWEHRREADRWSRAALMALRSHASVLPQIVPKDIADWCPAYPTNDTSAREAFWIGLLSTLAKHESTFRPTAVGGGGKWYGLLQILPATARGYRCRAQSRDALKDGGANLQCALRIMATTVPRDGVVSHRMRGVAADWGPFHSRNKSTDMMAWMRSQPYCAGLSRSLRPVARPVPVVSNPVISTQGF
ncbi:transglycosylase SLT domain-containing protein [Marivita hallyeonensis]|nr:transglycosylase SLT domain-containing protein [Marivita hallyeonensis]